jgi:transposase
LKGSKVENKSTRTRYDRDFKVSAVKLILEKHQSISKVSRDLGVSQNSLHKWKKAFIADSRNCFPGNGKVTEHEEEIRRLKRELELVKEERDILKKAVVIFSGPKQ